uniref:Zgc:100829 n=1 Tax=Paramormyrops kingsleyae TaxID=1676925 RepID=A0A3B3QE90_9TELE
MLQQILKDMHIDPDMLEALNDDQKKILFFKMREEQVRRWKEREENLEREAKVALKSRPKKVHSKSVSWLLGRDGDVHVVVIGEMEELKTSKVIYSGLGERDPSSLHDNARPPGALKSSLVRRTPSEPVRTGRENFPPRDQSGVEISFKEKTGDSKARPHVPSQQTQVLEKSQQSSSPQETEKEADSGSPADGSKGAGPSTWVHLKLRSPASVPGKPRGPDPQEKHVFPFCAKARLCPRDSLDQHHVKDGIKSRAAACEDRRAAGSHPAGLGAQHASARMQGVPACRRADGDVIRCRAGYTLIWLVTTPALPNALCLTRSRGKSLPLLLL